MSSRALKAFEDEFANLIRRDPLAGKKKKKKKRKGNNKGRKDGALLVWILSARRINLVKSRSVNWMPEERRPTTASSTPAAIRLAWAPRI
jgi:hypothetical protein